MQSALQKERRELKQQQREEETSSVPVGINKNWIDPLPEGKQFFVFCLSHILKKIEQTWSRCKIKFKIKTDESVLHLIIVWCTLHFFSIIPAFCVVFDDFVLWRSSVGIHCLSPNPNLVSSPDLPDVQPEIWFISGIASLSRALSIF